MLKLDAVTADALEADAVTAAPLLEQAAVILEPSAALTLAVASVNYALSGKPIRVGNPNTITVRLATLDRQLTQESA